MTTRCLNTGEQTQEWRDQNESVNLLRGSWMESEANFNRLTVCHPLVCVWISLQLGFPGEYSKSLFLLLFTLSFFPSAVLSVWVRSGIIHGHWSYYNTTAATQPLVLLNRHMCSVSVQACVRTWEETEISVCFVHLHVLSSAVGVKLVIRTHFSFCCHCSVSF